MEKNLEKFKNGEINLLYIIGYSGSGKSTLGRKMRNSDTEVIEHDMIDLVYCMTASDMKEQGNLFYSFFKENDELYDLLREDSEVIRNIAYEKFCEFALEYSKKHKEKKFIIEGTRSLNPYIGKKFDDFAIIMMETSLIKSFWRALKRNSVVKGMFGEREKNPFRVIKRFFKCLFNKRRWKYYRDCRENFKKLRNQLSTQSSATG